MYCAKVLTILKSFLWLLMLEHLTRFLAGKNFSESYKKHLSVMSSLIDEFYDPCEDFFKHACGYYDTTVAPIAPFMYNKEASVRFFEINRVNFTTKGGILLDGLYDSCKQRKWDSSQWKSIKFLEEFNQWPFLYHQWENSTINTTWPKLTARLAAGGVPVLFDVFFARNTVYISPADIRCPETPKDIETLLMSPATSVVNPQVAYIISSELWSFCKELNGELPRSVENISEVTGEAESKEFFDEFFEILQITQDQVEASRKILIRIQRLEEIFAVANRTEPRIVANFIIWKMLETLDYDDCFQLTEEFEPLLLSEYWNWGVLKPMVSKEVALASFLYHTTRYQKRLKDHMYPQDLESFLNKKRRPKDLNLKRLIKKYAQKNLDSKIIESEYSGLEMQRDAFLQNYFNMKQRQLKISFIKNKYVDKDNHNHSENFVRKFLNFAILTMEQPLFHYFASEGFDLWYNSGFLTSTDDLYTADDCLDRQSDLYIGEYPIFENLTSVQKKDVLKFNRAFHESFYDYVFWLEGEKLAFAEDIVLQHFNLNSSQVLFYSVAQMHCGRNDDKYATLINRSFMNSLEFEDAFECDLEMPMNPGVKCMCKDC